MSSCRRLPPPLPCALVESRAGDRELEHDMNEAEARSWQSACIISKKEDKRRQKLAKCRCVQSIFLFLCEYRCEYEEFEHKCARGRPAAPLIFYLFVKEKG